MLPAPSLLRIGSDAVINGWGIRIKNATNIEVRNLAFMLTDADEGDNLSLQQDNTYIWAHNNDLFYGKPGSDADQIKGDGALDAKKSTYITFSYNHFWDNGKSSLLGLSENTTAGLYITYHHNWFDHSDSRHPRVGFILPMCITIITTEIQIRCWFYDGVICFCRRKLF
jgi:pectate lyase